MVAESPVVTEVRDPVFRWMPATAAQKMALDCEADLLCFGGSAGSLKTETILMDAAQERDNPNFRGIVFRTNLTEFTDIIDKTNRLYRGMGASYVDSPKWTWTFPSGANLRFGYLTTDNDVWKYLGPRYSFIGFDESTFRSEAQVRNILGRLSSTDPSLKLRARFATNPGGPGADYHIKVFLRDHCPVHEPGESAVPGKLYYDCVWPSDGKKIPFSVAFIPGKLTDHTLLDPEYIQRLRMMTGANAEAMETGCWCKLEGSYFSIWNKHIHVVPWASIGIQWWHNFWISIDYGFGKSSASAHLHVRVPGTDDCPEGRIFTVGELVESQMPAYEFAQKVATTFIEPLMDGNKKRIVAIYADPANFNPNYDTRVGGGHSVADQMNEVLNAYGLRLSEAANDRIGGWQLIYKVLATRRWKVADNCPLLIDAIPTAMHDEKKPGDVLKVPGSKLDDVRDEVRYGLYTFITQAEKPNDMKLAELVRDLSPTAAMMTRAKFREEVSKTSGPVFVGRNALQRQKMYQESLRSKRNF